MSDSMMRISIDIDPRATLRGNGGKPLGGEHDCVRLSWQAPSNEVISLYITGAQARELAAELNRITTEPVIQDECPDPGAGTAGKPIQTEPEMGDIRQAAEWLRQGKRVRRKAWTSPRYLAIADGDRAITDVWSDTYANRWIPTSDALLATDYLVVTEP